MAIYSIRDLEKLTGIKKHTIRMWEQRYHLITPARTDTNIRFYTDENLRHLFNVALLNKHGHKISKLAKMQPEEIATLVAGIAEKNNNPNAQIDALTLAMLSMDEAGFDRIFSTYALDHSFEQTMIDLVYPLLENLKALWITRSVSPAHEKFVSHLIRRKLMCAIDGCPLVASRDGEIFYLYLPEGESQELTLLFMYFLLRQRGHHVIYLGPGTSVNDLRDACDAIRPHFVFTIIDAPLARQSTQAYVESAAQMLHGAQLLLSGAQLFLSPIKLPANARVLNGLGDTLGFLDTLKGKRA
jgi:MerR family transcriptional regulator, light-induced transcriptional regulator